MQEARRVTARTVSSPAPVCVDRRALCSIVMRPRLLRYVAFAAPVALATGLALLSGFVSSARADSAGTDGTTTLYRWVDAQGVTHFSDTPQPGAEKIEVSPAQTFASTPTPGSGSAPPPPAAVYQACDISQPTAEQSFYAPEVVGVSVRLVPDLREGDQLSVTVDGRELQSIEGSVLDFELPMPDRGAHMLQAVVRDAQGHALCSSASITFYVQRPSLLSPQSPTEGRGTPPPIPRH